MKGDGEIVAHVGSLQNTDPWAKAGVMIRETLTPGSTHAFSLISVGNGAAFQRRVSTGGASDHTAGAAVAAPYWTRLTRTGNVFRAYSSSNGTAWTLIDAVTIPMTTNVFAGLAVTAHNNASLNNSVFDSVTGTFGPNQPPLVSLLFPTNQSTFVQPSLITLSAAASDSDGTITKVEFLNGTNLLGTVTTPPYSLAWSNVEPDSHILTVRATDNLGGTTTSSPIAILVLQLDQLLTPVLQNGGEFRLSFHAPDNRTRVVETSEDLVHWTPIFTNAPNNGLFDYIDLKAVESRRFYRVKQ